MNASRIRASASIQRALVLATAIALAISAAGFVTLGSYDGLTFGGSTIGGDTPLLLGFSGVDATYPRTIFYAYQPHGELRLQVGVANRGRLPVTIRGLAPDGIWSTWFESAAIRLPPAPTLDALPLYPPAGGGRWYSETFRPFELAPGAATTFALVLGLRNCGPRDLPMPTRDPSASPSAGYTPEAAYSPIGTMPIGYSVGGIDAVARVQLPEAIAVVQRGQETGCPAPEDRTELQNGTAPAVAPS